MSVDQPLPHVEPHPPRDQAVLDRHAAAVDALSTYWWGRVSRGDARRDAEHTVQALAAAGLLIDPVPPVGVGDRSVRHFIGTSASGMRLNATIEGAHPDALYRPLPMSATVGLAALADETAGRSMWPVDEATAREWNTDEEVDDAIRELLAALDRGRVALPDDALGPVDKLRDRFEA